MRQTSEVAVVAVGMTFLIICRQFDLSVGSTFGLSAEVIGVLVRDLGFGMWPAFICALILRRFYWFYKWFVYNST
jgi:ribose transport system permease protein